MKNDFTALGKLVDEAEKLEALGELTPAKFNELLERADTVVEQRFLEALLLHAPEQTA